MPGSPTRWGFVSVAAPIAGFIGGLFLLIEGQPLLGIGDFREYDLLGLVSVGCIFRLRARRCVYRPGTDRTTLDGHGGWLCLMRILPGAFLCSGVSSLWNWLRFG